MNGDESIVEVANNSVLYQRDWLQEQLERHCVTHMVAVDGAWEGAPTASKWHIPAMQELAASVGAQLYVVPWLQAFLQSSMLQRSNVLSPAINLHDYPYAIVRWGDLINNAEAWLVKGDQAYDPIPVPRKVQTAKRFTCLTHTSTDPYEVNDDQARVMAQFINKLATQYHVRGIILYAFTLHVSNLTWVARTRRNSFTNELALPANMWLACCDQSNAVLKGGLELVYVL